MAIASGSYQPAAYRSSTFSLTYSHLGMLHCTNQVDITRFVGLVARPQLASAGASQPRAGGMKAYKYLPLETYRMGTAFTRLVLTQTCTRALFPSQSTFFKHKHNPLHSHSFWSRASESTPATESASMAASYSSSVEELQDLIKSSNRILAVCGAGLSAASGLPTFRGAGGLWRNHEPTLLATVKAFKGDPGLVWLFYAWRRHLALQAKPNHGHIALAELAKKKENFLCITQNVDREFADVSFPFLVMSIVAALSHTALTLAKASTSALAIPRTGSTNSTAASLTSSVWTITNAAISRRTTSTTHSALHSHPPPV